KALDQGKVPEEALAQSRLTMAKTLLEFNLELPLVRKLLVFLKNILYVDNEEINRKFDEEVLQLTNNNIKMGVIELIRKRDREKGINEGRKEGIKEGTLAIAKRLMVKGHTLEEIAEVTGLSIAEI